MKHSPPAPSASAPDEPEPATGEAAHVSESSAAAMRARARIEVSFADEDLPPVAESRKPPAGSTAPNHPHARITGLRPDSEDDFLPILDFADLLMHGANTSDRKPRSTPPVDPAADSGAHVLAGADGLALADGVAAADSLAVNRTASTVAPGSVARSAPRLGGVSLSDVPPPVAQQAYGSWNGPTETAHLSPQEPIAIASGSMHDALNRVMPRSYTPENTGMDQESLRIAIEARRREMQNAIATAPPPARSAPQTRRPSSNISARPSAPGARNDRALPTASSSLRPRSIAVREEVPAAVRKRDPRSEE